jgi:uncharacterized protein
MLIIKISNLSNGSHSFSFNEKVEDINLEEPFSDRINIELELQKSNNQIIINANILVNANFICDRCTKDYVQLLKTKYEMVYLFGKDEIETDSLNITYLPIDADKIDVGKDVKDFAVLAIPMKKLCNEHCKGLCYKCGKDLNEEGCECPQQDIDPRWRPLEELKKKLSNN